MYGKKKKRKNKRGSPMSEFVLSVCAGLVNLLIVFYSTLSDKLCYNLLHKVWEKWEIPGNFWKKQK